MNELSHTHLHQDDQILVDYLTGQIEEDLRDKVARRLTEDSEFAARAARVNQLLMLLDACPAESPSELLISRTLATVGSQSAAGSLRRRAVFKPSGTLPFGLKEFAATAALLFIVAAVLMPVFNHAQRLYRQQACAAAAAKIGGALIQYSSAHAGHLPATGDASAGWLPGAPTQRAVSNSSNLWKLVKGSFADIDLFRCPSVEHAENGATTVDDDAQDFPGPQYVDYSYHNAVNAPPVRLDRSDSASGIAILADRSPVFRGVDFDPASLMANSPNHGGHGQSVLYLDMHAQWADKPSAGLNGDNIWLLQNILRYRGDERPSSTADSFLLPAYVPSRR